MELTLSMTCVQVGKDKGWKMLPVLKGVVLLDTSEREVRVGEVRLQSSDRRNTRDPSIPGRRNMTPERRELPAERGREAT